MVQLRTFVQHLPASWQRALRAWNAHRQFLGYREEAWSWSPVIRKLVGTGDVVVDAGANLGYLTRLFAEWVGSGGRVYSFEPVPDTYQWLFQNVSKSKLSQVTPFPHGLSDQVTQVRMEIPAYENGVENFYESRIVTDGNMAEGVRVVDSTVAPLDQYAEQLTNLRLIKIDVEGHECSVIRGAESLIAQWHPALLIEVQGDPGQRPETQELWDRLTSEAYTPYVQDGKGLVVWTPGCDAVDVLFLREDHRNVLRLNDGT